MLCVLQAQLGGALKNVDAWRNAFQDASSGGLDARAVVDPATAASELKRLRSSAEKQPTEDVSTIRSGRRCPQETNNLSPGFGSDRPAKADLQNQTVQPIFLSPSHPAEN